MPKQQRLLPLAALEQLLKLAGAERVGDDAKVALKEALEKYTARLGASAVKWAQHAGRKTVRAEDIKRAVEQQ